MLVDGPFWRQPTKEQLITILLGIMVMIAAISIISSKHLARSTLALSGQLTQQRELLLKEQSELLLEKATWAADHRIETIATTMGMHIPEHVEMIGP